MRIVYLHQYFTTPNMVGGTRSYEMARRLVRWGHEVHMVTSDYCGHSRRWVQTEEDGIHVHWAPVRYSNQMGFKRRIVAFLRFAILAARRAARLPGDLIFATSTPLTIALPGVYAARRKSIPMVFEVRDLWPEMPILFGALRSRPAIAAARWLERFAYRNARHIVALGEGLAAGVRAAGYPEDRITIIPNGCDLKMFRVPQQAGHDFRRRYPWLGDRPLVVYTGTLGKANGVDYLARLAAAVHKRDSEVRFLVVGSGREEDKVRATAEELRVLNRNLFMHAPLPKNRMPAVLSAADIAIVTIANYPWNFTEASNKALDAFAAGRPVAINHQRGIAEIIRQTGSGLVLRDDLESAAGQLIRAIRSPQWCSRARAAAARLAEERFDRDVLASTLESVLKSVLPGVGQDRERRLAA